MRSPDVALVSVCKLGHIRITCVAPLGDYGREPGTLNAVVLQPVRKLTLDQ